MEHMGFLLSIIVISIIAVICFLIIAIWLLAGYIASAMNFHGWQWWCITLLAYIMIGGLIGAIYKIGD